MGRASTSRSNGEGSDDGQGPGADPEAASIGAHIKRLREARGLTQEQLAELAGIAADTLRRLEHGGFSPTMRTLRHVVRGLGVSLTTLFGSHELLRVEFSSDLAEMVATRPVDEQNAIARLWREFATRLDERKAGTPDAGTVVEVAGDKPTRSPFGRHIRSLRRARGMTQEQLGEAAGLSADTIRRLEHGSFSPSLDTLTKLCGGLAIERSTLFLSFEEGERGVERELADLLHLRSPKNRQLGLLLLRFAFEIFDTLDNNGR